LRKAKLKQILKEALFFISYYSGALHLLIIVLKKIKKKHYAAILFYHRFSPGLPDVFQLPHLGIHEFKKGMNHIKKFYNVITMDELVDRLNMKKEFYWPSIVITIDDGYLNNYTLAYPILKELNLPATIYLTTGFIGTSNAPWVDDLMDILSLTKAKSLRFPELLGKEVVDISTPWRKMEVFIRFFETMTDLDHERKILAIEKLSKTIEEGEVCEGDAERKMLGWNEVVEMSKNNISFGAHTISHPTLSKMELQEAKQEIFGSKMEIEARIGSKVSHFAIPNGRVKDFNEDLKKYCKEIGFKTVVSTEPGSISLQSDPYFLKRINPPAPIYIFACEMARYMFLKKME
jgi:peptidoglycan/xylan/chitin deacetylase (PgdA/CDA1 family)